MTTVLCHCRNPPTTMPFGLDTIMRSRSPLGFGRSESGADRMTRILSWSRRRSTRGRRLKPHWTSAENTSWNESDGIDMATVRVEYFDEVGSGKL